MPPTAEKTWENCLTQISDQIPTQSFRTWFAPITPLAFEQNDETARLRLAVPDAFHTEWLESHYAQVIRKAANDVVGQDTCITYEVAPGTSKPARGATASAQSAQQVPHGLDASTMAHAHPPPEGNRAASDAASSISADVHEASAPSAANGVSIRNGGVHEPAPFNGRPHGAATDSSAAPNRSAASIATAKEGAASSDTTSNGHARWTPAPPAVDRTQAAGPPSARPLDNRLKPEYTFDSFIEGDCNRLARSAAVAIAQNPGGTSFNPFMVYGGVGLGKTHIVQAIGNHVTQGGKVQRVLYVSSEQFTSQFVRSIQENRISDFSNFYRQIDLLIVDDVQFFGGKEKTQEEFFHVFNELHQTGKQIILCADRPPSEISGIEERLLSRFKWGLSADIQPPDLETRIAILQNKSAQHGVSLHPQIIDFVAERIRANIRQLEGALLKLAAHSDLYGREIDLDAAKEILRDMIDDYQVRLEIEDIQRSVAKFYGVATELLSAKTRKREIVTARHVAMYFSKQLTSHSLKSIGLRFGGRDHSTVIHACNTIEDRIELEPAFREEVGRIQQKLERRTPMRSGRQMHSGMGVA